MPLKYTLANQIYTCQPNIHLPTKHTPHQQWDLLHHYLFHSRQPIALLKSFSLLPKPTRILDPIVRQLRRTKETERRAHQRAHNRQRAAQSGRILSQFEAQDRPLRHCGNCVEYEHDKARCRGCRATGHTRSRCPNTVVGSNYRSSTSSSGVVGSGSGSGSGSGTNFQDFTGGYVPATQYQS